MRLILTSIKLFMKVAVEALCDFDFKVYLSTSATMHFLMVCSLMASPVRYNSLSKTEKASSYKL